MKHQISKTALTITAIIMSGLATANQGADEIPNNYLDNASFCTDMQNDLSGIKPGLLESVNTLFNSNVGEEGSLFRRAKVEINPLTTRQLNVHDANGIKQIMCKTKARDGLMPETGDVFSGKEGDCSDATKTLLRQAFATLSAENQSIAAVKLGDTTVDTTVYDQFGGLVWANPGAFETIVVDSDGTIHLRSESLETPNNPNTAISNLFVDLLNGQLAGSGIMLPYGTTYADLIAMGFVNPKELGTRYCTVPSIDAIQRALLK